VTGTAASTVHALVIGDSPAQRAELIRVLQHDGDIAVVAESGSTGDAVGLVTRILPHVVVLGLAGDGARHVIEQVMARVPTPILVLQPRAGGRHAAAAVDALVAGALEVVPVPEHWTPPLEARLRHSVRQLRKVTVIRHPRGALPRLPRHQPEPGAREQAVVALGASTGGPSALATVLSALHGLRAPVLVVQHLHPDFTAGLIGWMSRASALPVKAAEHGELALPGHVYLAPGELHLRLGAGGRLELVASPVTVHRPSADQLFESVAARAGRSGVGVLLTGMGEDGARGLLEMHRAGARTFAQDEASSAVFGMPRAALRLGAVSRSDLLGLDQLAAAICRVVSAVPR
jgi:two-component system chemotaxis response regulator CheB